VDKFTAVIVDDEKHAIAYLSNLLSEYKQIDVLGSYDLPDEAIKNIMTLQPDIIFLDVQMPYKTGFDVLKAVRFNTYNPQVIFTTGYEKFALKAIKHAAFDYLLKPIDKAELRATLGKLKKIEQTEDSKLQLDKLLSQIKKRKKLKFKGIKILTFVPHAHCCSLKRSVISC